MPAERNGERVVVYQRLYCGQCRYCLSGRQDLCRNSRVLGESGGGGYAEFTCAPARNAIRMPDGLDMKSAALAVCPVGTSVRAALGVAQVEPGQTVLITGAGGGLGLHQIQVVKSVNAHVIAVTSSQEKAEIISQAGADEVIISPDLKFSGEVWRRTGKQGVDVVLENVVSSTFGESLRSTAQNAIVVVLGNISAKRVEIDPGLIIARRIRIAGSGNATYKDVRIALHLPRHRRGQAVHRGRAAVPARVRRPRHDGAARGRRPRRPVRVVTCTSAPSLQNSRIRIPTARPS